MKLVIASNADLHLNDANQLKWSKVKILKWNVLRRSFFKNISISRTMSLGGWTADS
jgi:hypothetical protein